MGNCIGKEKEETLQVGEEGEVDEEEGCSIGFRFCPTDEELIVHYLMKKLLGEPLPNNVVKDVDFYSFYPSDLHSQHRIMKRVKESYFFTQPQSHRAFAGGFWNQVGNVVYVKNTFGTNIGVRRILVFNKSIRSQSEKTDWVVHEYERGGVWVLCKLFNTSSVGNEELKRDLLDVYDLKKALFWQRNNQRSPHHVPGSSTSYPSSMRRATSQELVGLKEVANTEPAGSSGTDKDKAGSSNTHRDVEAGCSSISNDRAGDSGSDR